MNSQIADTKSLLSRYKHYFTELLVLAFPILIGNLGHTLIGATDILVVAKYDINALAAITIANSVFFTIFIFGLGILFSISVILANMRGERKPTKQNLPASLFFAFILAIVFTALSYFSKYLIDFGGFEEHLVPYIKQYISIVSFSIIGMYMFEGIKQFLQAHEIVKFPNMLLLYSVVLNLIFDVVFVFGFGPIPSMGVKGAAIATTLVRMIMGLVMLLYVIKILNLKAKTDYGYIKQMIKIGIPIGFGLLLEFLAFNIITIFVGRESGLLAATHNIITTISSATFMLPLSIATALSVKIGYYYGACNKLEIKNYSIAGMIMGVGIMALAGIILALFPRQIISLFTSNTEVIKIALPIISIAAMYQVFDGFQVVSGGILKGFKLTKVVSNSVLIGYWMAGFPVALVLVGRYHMSLRGYWFALAVSLCVMGMVQASVARYKYNKICQK